MITRVGIVAKARLRAAAGHLCNIAAWLEARGVEPVFEKRTAALAATPGPGDDLPLIPLPTSIATFSKEDLPRHVDLVLVLGGDGTLLSMANRIGAASVSIPILGVNFGSLGFLTEITLPELYPSLEAALAGTARIDERIMLRCRVKHGSDVLAEHVALNDVVVNKGALARIIELSVSVGGQFVTRLRADGLIIASPTGSTAYNLAISGPIVHPAVDALILTPIAPHTLSQRPVVIPAAAEVIVQPSIYEAADEVYVTADGQAGQRLEAGDLVHVERAEQPLRLISATTRSYFEVLREKLKWGGG